MCPSAKVQVMKISLIMPVYNEERFLKKSLTSLTKQTLKPTQIIVIDDGSTDNSLNIIKEYDVTVINLLKKSKQASINRYPLVLSAGSRYLNDDFNYVGIIDADTVLESTYYEKLTKRMQQDKTIGIAGGQLIGQPAGPALGLMPYVYGANRLYTKDCWLKLNNGKIMKPIPQIDFYHNIYAEMLGFKTQRYRDIKSWALRPSSLGNPFVKGYHAYEFGYNWFYLLLRAIRNRAPAMVSGYLKAKYSGCTQYPIKPYVEQLQLQRLKTLVTRGFSL